MLVMIYGISAGFGFINYFRFRLEGGLSKIFQAFLAFGLALIFCHFRWQGILNGEIKFSIMNLFAMFALVCMHINLWFNVFEHDFTVFVEKFFCSIFFAFVSAFACWWCFASTFC